MKLSDLVTCIVEPDGPRWTLTWVSDGKTPRDSSAESVAAAIESGSSEIAALYASHKEALEAELQFAIYPWQGNAGEVILDITRDGTELVATDIQGSGITFRAPAVDGLIEGAERYVPDTTKEMLRWIRRVSELG